MNTEQEQELLIRLFGHAVHAKATLWDILSTIEKITGVEIEESDISQMAEPIDFAGGAATGWITIEQVEETLGKCRKRTSTMRVPTRYFSVSR